MIACVRECVGRAGSRSVSSIRERGADDCAGACGVPYFVGEFRLSTRTELLFLSRSIQRPRRFSEFVCIYRQGGRGCSYKITFEVFSNQHRTAAPFAITHRAGWMLVGTFEISPCPPRRLLRSFLVDACESIETDDRIKRQVYTAYAKIVDSFRLIDEIVSELKKKNREFFRLRF